MQGDSDAGLNMNRIDRSVAVGYAGSFIRVRKHCRIAEGRGVLYGGSARNSELVLSNRAILKVVEYLLVYPTPTLRFSIEYDSSVYSWLLMLKILKKTWKEEEALSKNPQVSPAPSLTTPSSPNTDFENTHTHDDIPNLILDASPFISHPKRTRDAFEPDVNDPALFERPVKLFKTGNADSLRNRLPEILDFREREENEPQLSILTLKEQVFEQAKHQNSEYGFLLDLVASDIYALFESYCRPSPCKM